MRILYMDCSMGAAGDMITAALLELLPDKEAFLGRLNEIGIPKVKYLAEPCTKNGIVGTSVRVLVDGAEEGLHEHNHDYQHSHSHEHRAVSDIEHIVAGLNLPDKVKEDVKKVYGIIAEAESAAHNVPVNQVHFHEVGNLDAVADVAAACLLLRELAPEKIVVSPIHVGSGEVRCAHGIMPVPAPATARILRGVPIYSGKVRGELCTPTGAAILTAFADNFGYMPTMRVSAIGYGMGKKDFEAANCLRAMLGEAEQGADRTKDLNSGEYVSADKTEDEVTELACNVDDMTAEEIAFCCECLIKAGARDVYTCPIVMKKGRPGTLINVMCAPKDKEKFLKLLFFHTTTIGIRETVKKRYILDREEETVETTFGDVRRKISSGYGVRRVKWEYEDIARIAQENGMSLREVRADCEYRLSKKGRNVKNRKSDKNLRR